MPEYNFTLIIWDTKYETQGYGLSSLLLWGASNLTPVGTVGSFPGNSSYDLPQSTSSMKNMSSLEDTSLRYIMYSTYPEDGGSKLLLHVSTACTHCTISHKPANFTHEHHCENTKCHYCIFLSFNAW